MADSATGPGAFTTEEVSFMRDGAVFDRKEELTRRIQGIFRQLQKELSSQLDPDSFLAPEGTDFVSGQLVRGERFHSRPYVYLDYPKFFSRQAIFTYRSFFWWGWDFVFAFLLAGPHLGRYQDSLLTNLDDFRDPAYYLSVAADPWQWRRDSPETLKIAECSKEEIRRRLGAMTYMKLQYFLGLDDPVWREGRLVGKGLEVFNRMRCVVSR